MSGISNIRRAIWPIESVEYKKFFPMATMLLFILMNFSMFRSIKDGLVLSNIGAESISFLKLYFVLPSSILAVIAYMKLCDIFESQKVFYVVLSFFTGYLVLFTFVLYPYPELVHPSYKTVENLVMQYPNFKWFIKILSNWSFATFYIIAELWGAMMLSLLFWQFANYITPTDQAKRFYPIFPLVGNIGLLCTSGIGGYFLSEKVISQSALPFRPILLILILSCAIITCSYWWINNYVLTDPQHFDPTKISSKKKKKAKLSIVESLKLIFSSKYIMLIVVVVLSYGMSINLIEGIWKARIKQLYVTSENITRFMTNFQGIQAVATMIFTIIGSNILRKTSWTFAALLTPIMLLVTGVLFFGIILFSDTITGLLSAIMIINPLALAVAVGTIQNVLSKASKYSLFDSTKEMSYIPLDDELKTKGKAAVDVIGGRLAKSGGAVIQSTFFLVFAGANFDDAYLFFAVIFFCIILAWLYSANELGKEYNKLTNTKVE